MTSIRFPTRCAPRRLAVCSRPAAYGPPAPPGPAARAGEGRRAAVRTRAAAVRADRAVVGRGPEVRLGGSLHRSALPRAAADHSGGDRRAARPRGPHLRRRRARTPARACAGFVVMLGAAALGIQAFRRGRHPELRVVGGTDHAPHPARVARGGSFIDRLEERWRHRPEGRALTHRRRTGPGTEQEPAPRTSQYRECPDGARRASVGPLWRDLGQRPARPRQQAARVDHRQPAPDPGRRSRSSG